jgi:protein-disulfide isomerase
MCGLKKCFLVSAFVLCVTLITCQVGRTQQEIETQASIQQEVVDLKQQIQTLIAEQRQILDLLKELKQKLPTNSPTPPLSQPPLLPSALDIQGKSFRGESSASVALIEYSDFECPYCGMYEREISPRVLENYIKTGRVRLFYRELPLYPHALSAARAARCAGAQGDYWEMHERLYAKQTALSDPSLLDRAKTLGLDAKKFSECLSSDRYSNDIRKSMAEAQWMGVEGTPTFFIGTIGPEGDVVKITKKIVGTHPYMVFQSALDEALTAKSQEAASAHRSLVESSRAEVPDEHYARGLAHCCFSLLHRADLGRSRWSFADRPRGCRSPSS